jgi:hypothetical protein
MSLRRMSHLAEILRFVRAALCVVLLSSLSGCTLWSVKPVAVTVRDAETGEPLPAAKITIDYSSDANVMRKQDVTVWTDGYGSAALPAGKSTAGASAAAAWHIEARHYINTTIYGMAGERVPPELRPGVTTTSPATSTPVAPVAAASHAAKSGDVADIRIYRMPVPSVAVIVGDKFRGRIVLHIRRSDEWIQDGQPGKREFTFSPDADGLIEIDATPLLARELCRPFGFSAIRFRTRSDRELDKDWANFSALSRSRAAPDNVCARLITETPRWEKGVWRETTSVWVVGTAADARAASSTRSTYPQQN